jgi:hypothetical protein
MTRPLRIANCSGFFGDRLSAAKEMVDDGAIDVLTGDWLAELTMLILARIKAKRPEKGYADSFVAQMEQVMGSCLERGIKVVSNAGGLNPQGCAEALAQVAQHLGLKPKIAYVTGDNLLPRLGTLGNALTHFETGAPLQDHNRFISANAYLGCWGIVEALNQGADIVITGRTTDAAIVCGPAAWHHGWRRDDWDALAGAVVAGHVIECGTQATGGNYSFFTEVPGLERAGFPWAEVYADGSSVIGKHEGTGGEVSIGTVTSQLLYEIASQDYLGPDVTARFDSIRLQSVAPNRVRIYGCTGAPPPATLKVAMNEIGGWRNELAVALTGLDVEAKSHLLERAFWRACPFTPQDYASVTTQLLRTAKADPASNEEATAVWKLTLKDKDEARVGRPVFNAATEMALATIPGFYLLGGEAGKEARPYGVYTPATIGSELVPQQVTLMGQAPVTVSSVAPARSVARVVRSDALCETTVDSPDPSNPAGARTTALPTAPASSTLPAHKATTRLPLGRLVGARSGDKGGNANLGVFVRNEAAWPWLNAFMTLERLRELLPEVRTLQVDRFALPNIQAINFVIHGLLQEGVAASTRQDGQAKSLGEWLRAREADLPLELLNHKEAP